MYVAGLVLDQADKPALRKPSKRRSRAAGSLERNLFLQYDRQPSTSLSGICDQFAERTLTKLRRRRARILFATELRIGRSNPAAKVRGGMQHPAEGHNGLLKSA